jgi:hypothetical protein
MKKKGCLALGCLTFVVTASLLCLGIYLYACHLEAQRRADLHQAAQQWSNWLGGDSK